MTTSLQVLKVAHQMDDAMVLAAIFRVFGQTGTLRETESFTDSTYWKRMGALSPQANLLAGIFNAGITLESALQAIAGHNIRLQSFQVLKMLCLARRATTSGHIFEEIRAILPTGTLVEQVPAGQGLDTYLLQLPD